MSMRRRDISPPPRGAVGRGGGDPLAGSSKLRMDRNPTRAKINDPSHPAGKRKEIDNVMKKARAFPNETWDKKLLEAEEKDPNRWRHSGYKKLYLEDDPSSSDSERPVRFGNGGRRSRSPRSPPRNRRTPSPLPPMRKRHLSPHSPIPMRRRSPSPINRKPHPPEPKRRPRSPSPRMRRKSPPPPMMRRPLSPELRRRSPPPRMGLAGSPRRERRMSPQPLPPSSKGGRLPPVPRSKRPPSPPPRMSRSASMSSCSDDSCSACSVEDHRRRRRSRSRSFSHPRPRVRSPLHSNGSKGHRSREGLAAATHESRLRPMSPPPPVDPRRKQPPPPASENLPKTHRTLEKDSRERSSRPIPQPSVPEQRSRRPQTPDSDRDSASLTKRSKHSSTKVPTSAEDPQRRSKSSSSRAAKQQLATANGHEAASTLQPVAGPSSSGGHKKHKEKSVEKLRARVKIEGEPKQARSRPRSPSSGSEESSSSESSLPRFTATTRLTLSERFGKMAQWSVDRSNMENMRITKNSAGGDLKVMIEEELEAPPTRYTYSPAPAGHFPEELMTTGPSGLSSWDDVRVRYEYYKGRGYLRDLDLQDYIKWEEWWYKYQEWLKQERYYELWERSQMNRRRKKVPISQRLN
uniref:Putative transcriptional regulator icp4 n=1 Tax=Anopheles triannulatus TaxID=58253 RepID=A0A2M4AHC4_9DIPT